MPTRKLNAFGAMKIKAGESLAKRVDLTEFFILDSQGNFAISAVVRDPNGGVEGSSTNRMLFNLNPGRTYWSQKVGVGQGSGNQTRELKLLTFSNGQKTQLYAQVIDGHTGSPLQTFPLGDALMLRRPMVTLDGKQRMHVMYLATPSMWVHCQISADGKLVARDMHQRAAQGIPCSWPTATGRCGSSTAFFTIPEPPKPKGRRSARPPTDRRFHSNETTPPPRGGKTRLRFTYFKNH